MDKLRTYDWALFKGKMYPLSTERDVLVSDNSDDLKIGFELQIDYTFGNYYTRPIKPLEVDSAYHVENWGTVDGFKLRIMNYLDGVYYLMVDEKNEAMVKHFGVKPTGYDYLSTSVGKKDEEILDIWEVRTPIKGFPFREPSEVYLKFDGVWLI
ncbi:hypothetical protein [Acetobacteroides hydrogenigenes]|uniref:Uncharacterized protein n=1 Tax=Acetobacteroides hydrogenigenes TaxID=979970 RepID=A0A4R2E5I4_9BACT|nr:hypothetical protein [Acetobacteroides hydrogenigenes]TCN63081.1 hypothetical protein CLV25_11659 [Acetobacteroides hydrogenigenes]